MELSYPVLVVDLDGTFFKNDFFKEQLMLQILKRPFTTLLKYFKSNNWVEFKTFILQNTSPTKETVNNLINPIVLNYINTNRTNYTKIVMVSASPDSFVKRAVPSGIFDELHGSINVNLKSDKKLAFIIQHYGKNFHYIGNSKDDEVIFLNAKKSIKI